MCKVLLLIDYQKGFKSACSKATVPAIEKLTKRGGWDDIIQTMWLNSKEPDSPYIQNLGYTENSAYDRGHALVTKSKDAKIFTRYDKYSCFDLFDKGVPFRIVTDCIASERARSRSGYYE